MAHYHIKRLISSEASVFDNSIQMKLLFVYLPGEDSMSVVLKFGYNYNLFTPVFMKWYLSLKSKRQHDWWWLRATFNFVSFWICSLFCLEGWSRLFVCIDFWSYQDYFLPSVSNLGNLLFVCLIFIGYQLFSRYSLVRWLFEIYTLRFVKELSTKILFENQRLKFTK